MQAKGNQKQPVTEKQANDESMEALIGSSVNWNDISGILQSFADLDKSRRYELTLKNGAVFEVKYSEMTDFFELNDATNRQEEPGNTIKFVPDLKLKTVKDAVGNLLIETESQMNFITNGIVDQLKKLTNAKDDKEKEDAKEILAAYASGAHAFGGIVMARLKNINQAASIIQIEKHQKPLAQLPNKKDENKNQE